MNDTSTTFPAERKKEENRFIHGSEEINLAGYTLKVAALYIGFSFLFSFDFLHNGITLNFTRFTVWLTVLLLNISGVPVQSDNFLISSGNVAVNVATECSAAEVFLLFFSAVAAHSKALKEKLTGLLIGFSAIFLINLLRIIVLFLVAVYAKGHFELFHVYIGQAVVIAVTYGVWTLWIDNRLQSTYLFGRENLTLYGRILLFFFLLLAGLFFFDFLTHRNQPVPFALSSLLVWQSSLIFSSCGLDVSTIENIKTGTQNGGSVFITSGCLSTPLIVLYYAFILSWSFSLKQRILLALAGIPLFYLIISARVLTIFLLPHLEQEKLNFFYDNFYQIVFLFAFILFTTFTVYKNEYAKASRYLLLSCMLLLVFLFLWHSAGEKVLQILFETPLTFLLGHERTYNDSHFILSRAPVFYILLTGSLIPFMGGFSPRQRVLYGLFLFCCLWGWVTGLSLLLENVQIPLYPRILRMLTLFPLLAGWGYLLWRGSRSFIKKREENNAGTAR